jgi:hypothetical protein
VAAGVCQIIHLSRVDRLRGWGRPVHKDSAPNLRPRGWGRPGERSASPPISAPAALPGRRAEHVSKIPVSFPTSPAGKGSLTKYTEHTEGLTNCGSRVTWRVDQMWAETGPRHSRCRIHAWLAARTSHGPVLGRKWHSHKSQIGRVAFQLRRSMAWKRDRRARSMWLAWALPWQCCGRNQAVGHLSPRETSAAKRGVTSW